MPLISHGRANPLSTHIYNGIAALPGIKTVEPFKATFGWCKRFLGDLPERKLASNVWVVYETATKIGIRLYDTIIVRYYSDCRFSVDNGGFNTFTTAYRIDQFTPSNWHFYHANKQLWGGCQGWGGEHQPLTHDVRLHR